jgi:flagellar basal-body rod protein FlgB
MLENLFGIHEDALAAEVAADGNPVTNIANADTPGFKAKDVAFRKVLSRAYWVKAH